MFRRYLHIAVALFVSTFFLLAGTGYNAVHYCCDTCRAAGIEHVAEESCEAIHHHEHHHHDGNCCHHDSCWLRHLQVNDYTLAHSLAVPAIHEMVLIGPAIPALLDECVLEMCVSAELFGNPPPPGGGGQGILKDVCRWIC